MDTNTERDSHFQEYAKMVWRDLSDVIGEALVTSSRNFEEFDNKVDHIRLILAQRAYDFAWHVYDHVNEGDKWASLRGFGDFDENIPDLTEWPTPHDE